MKTSSENIKLAIALVTSLFFLWGLSYGLLDVMNKNFQTQLGITKANSGLLQAAYFGAYFIIAIPAAKVAEKFSYKAGIIMGLLLYAIGALMIIPASNNANFYLFLVAFFILACGLGSLETNANPYITKLGSDETSSFRINMAQSFNGVGQFIGPILGGKLFLSLSHGDLEANMQNVQMVYVGIAAIVGVIMLVFILTKMPDASAADNNVATTTTTSSASLFSFSHFRNGVIAQFLYVAAQVGAGAFFVNYAIDHWAGLPEERAAYLLSIALVAFMIGRVVSTPLMRKIPANKLLGIYSAINVLLVLLVYAGIDQVSVWILIGVFFFMSISFPTIFSLSLMHLPDDKVKSASSVLIMSIVGGALMPTVMGAVADAYGTAAGFLLLIPCFAFVVWYAFIGSKVKVSA